MRPRDIVRKVRQDRRNALAPQGRAPKPRHSNAPRKRLAYWRRSARRSNIKCVPYLASIGREAYVATQAQLQRGARASLASHRAFLARNGMARPRKRLSWPREAFTAQQRAFVRAGLPPFRPAAVAYALRLARERPGVPFRQELSDELMADL